MSMPHVSNVSDPAFYSVSVPCQRLPASYRLWYSTWISLLPLPMRAVPWGMGPGACRGGTFVRVGDRRGGVSRHDDSCCMISVTCSGPATSWASGGGETSRIFLPLLLLLIHLASPSSTHKLLVVHALVDSAGALQGRCDASAPLNGHGCRETRKSLRYSRQGGTTIPLANTWHCPLLVSRLGKGTRVPATLKTRQTQSESISHGKIHSILSPWDSLTRLTNQS